jgi:hypothetical protein
MNHATASAAPWMSLGILAERLQDQRAALSLARGATMGKQSYAEKLRDPRWQKKRMEILERDGWACSKCGATDKTLHVHHKRYEAGRDPWDYPGDALAALCEQCHEAEHADQQIQKPTLPPAVAAMRRIPPLECELVGLMLVYPELRQEACESLSPNDFLDLDAASMFTYAAVCEAMPESLKLVAAEIISREESLAPHATVCPLDRLKDGISQISRRRAERQLRSNLASWTEGDHQSLAAMFGAERERHGIE